MARIIGLRWGVGLFSLWMLGCGQSGPETAGLVQQPIVAGVPVTDNTGDTVMITIDEGGFGSGVIWENEATVATIVTAAHVIENRVSDNALNRRTITGALVERADGGDIVESVRAERFVPHPASTSIFLLDRGSSRLMPSALLDLGVIITDGGFETARNDVEPSTLTVEDAVGEPLIIQGYGPTNAAEEGQDEQPSAGKLFELGVTAEVSAPLRPMGRATRVQGSAILSLPTSGSGETTRGDSGGPVFDDVGTLLSVHRGETVDQRMASLAIADFSEWIEAVRIARGIVANGRFSNAVKSSSEIDQLIINTGDQWRVHVERCDGSRLVRNVARGSGIDVFESIVALTPAFFDSNKTADALVQLQMLPEGVRLVELLNPGDATSSPSPRLLSTSAYSSVNVIKLNGDDVDDIVAERVDGEVEHFYGAPFGSLEGPFGPDEFRTCRNAGTLRTTACGGDNADASCSCSPACANGGGSNCCPDVVAVCSNIFEDEFLRSIGGIALAPNLDPVPASGAQPVVRIESAPLDPVAGVLLDGQWVLCPNGPLLLGDPRNLKVFQPTSSGEKALTPRYFVTDPESGQGLIRVDGAVLPDGFRMQFFDGTPDVLRDEFSLRGVGQLPNVAGFSQVTFPAPSIQAFNADAFQVPFHYDLLLTGPLLAQDFVMRPGTPVFSQAGRLVSVTLSTIETELSRDGALVPARVHQQEPLVTVNAEPEDDRSSVRYFAEQVRARDAQRDFEGDALQDLWVLQQATASAFPQLSRMSITVPLADGTPAIAGTELTVGPAIGDDGNWTVAGRAKIGSKSIGIVWREIDSGAIQIWQLDENQQLVRSLDFTVAPPWQIKAINDIDGDGIGDWLWSNSVLNLNFYWIMNDWDLFEDSDQRSQLDANPALLLRDSNWFSGMPLIDENGDPAFELMAADHFPVPNVLQVPATGPEQAATDLLWQRVAGDDTVLWSMALEHRFCDELIDPLLLASCVDKGGGAIRTYEMTRSSANLVKPPEWRLAGTADYNRDGQADLVWHARELAQPSEANQVELWLSRPSGEFQPRRVSRLGEPLVIAIEEGREVLVR
jgi:hypothetical protein